MTRKEGKNIKKILVSSLIVMFVMSLMAGLIPYDLGVQPVSAASTKKAPIHINNTGSSAQTYYPVPLNITYDSDMNSDFSDIRVKNETAGTFVPYWIEDKLNDSWCNLWFNATSIPASSWCNDTYYLYYGDAGASSASNGTNTFEFFDDFDDDFNDAWAQLADMPEEKSQHGFEELNGILYAVGGETGEPVYNSNTTYAYNISSNTWSQKADAPVAVQSAVLRAVSGKLYLIGGNTGPTFINKTYEYDPSTNTWTEKADMPTAREDMGSAVVDGKIYVFGGLIRDPVTPINKVEVYDPVANTWGTKANMPTNRWSGDFACAYNGKIYIVSSSDTFTGYPNLYPITTVYEYDPVADTYTQKADIPTGRCYKEVEELDGKLYVMAGSTTPNCDAVTNKNEVYDVANNTWTEKVQTPYSALGAGLTKYDGKIYFSGGSFAGSGEQIQNSSYRLDDPTADPELNKWNITDSAGSHSIADSIITLSGNAGGNAYSITTKSGFSPNIALRTKSNMEVTAASSQITRIGWALSTGADAIKDGNDLQSNHGTHYAGCGNGIDYELTDIGATHFGDWHTYDIIRLGTSTKFYKDGNLINDCIYDLDGDRYLSLYVRDSEYTTQSDWILARKYASLELTASLGAEVGDCTTPVISDLTNSTPGTTTVTITWNTNQSADSRVKYSKNSDLSSHSWSSWDNDTSSISIGLSSLDTGTPYYYQAWSYNGTNSSCYVSIPAGEPYENFTTQSDTGGAYEITLLSGWNIIGWTDTTTRTASYVANDIGSNCIYMAEKNRTTGNYNQFNPSVPEVNNFNLERGWGYYSYATDETVWNRTT